MKPSAFEYHRPTTPEEAAELLAEFGDDAKVIAGGQSLMPMLNFRLAVFEHLIDIGRLTDLTGINHDSGSVAIGAITNQATVGRSALIRTSVPLLSRATPLIGHFPIRNRGTLGGSVAHADAAAEYPAVALTLDAEIETLSSAGRRTLPAAEFFIGMWTTALRDDEILTKVTFPIREGRSGFSIAEFSRRKGDFAMAGACVAVKVDNDLRVESCSIGLFGLGSMPIRATSAERSLVGCSIDELQVRDVAHAAVSGLESVPADLHGSAAYRVRVGATMVARALKSALEEATDD
ncbi:FAD binding domain-containing protein [Rhodococcus artemisiae]|uniref:Xanthine dehydrogenase family protein subunit M n=1 Tax=Rhodococcus artemisiae TaxID=714159 RepID=A0ABU7LJ14_9NOCA|nr:xanthine dehydrogenase family protein subunit M [Rhodococcus artemisiae]MEE2061495.1 xanthine dehydrogenase family protein subunit M [Rhodococcus artemisiae]